MRPLVTTFLLGLIASTAAGDDAGRAEAEKRVLAWLGQIGAADEERADAARRRFQEEDDALKPAPLRTALVCRPAALRRFAAEELGRLRDRDSVASLARRALEDADASVRDACATALRTIDDPLAVPALGGALFSPRPEVRVRAARAIGRLGRPEAAVWLLVRWERRSRDAVRAHFASTAQRSYVGDFDVEVA
jgi:HEAT repeat protein